LTIQKLYFIAEILIFISSLEVDVVYFSKTEVNFYQTRNYTLSHTTR
jgi:hypothetical protein